MVGQKVQHLHAPGTTWLRQAETIGQMVVDNRDPLGRIRGPTDLCEQLNAQRKVQNDLIKRYSRKQRE